MNLTSVRALKFRQEESKGISIMILSLLSLLYSSYKEYGECEGYCKVTFLLNPPFRKSTIYCPNNNKWWYTYTPTLCVCACLHTSWDFAISQINTPHQCTKISHTSNKTSIIFVTLHLIPWRHYSLLQISVYSLSVCLVFSVTISLFPAICSSIKSSVSNPNHSIWTGRRVYSVY